MLTQEVGGWLDLTSPDLHCVKCLKCDATPHFRVAA